MLRNTLLLIFMILAIPIAREYTAEEKLAQMFMLGFRGKTLTEFSEFVSGGHWGGYVFYAEDASGSPINFSDERQAAELLAAMAGSLGERRLTPFWAVDLEGGEMQLARRRDGRFVYFSSSREIAGTDTAGKILRAKTIAAYLKRLGFNLNLAPVVDIDRTVSGNSRSFGPDAEGVIDSARIFMEQHKAQGLVCTLKHFPGGSSKADWQPFKDLHKQAGLIMVSTRTFPALDPDAPAHRSKRAHAALRALGYQNIILTDDVSSRNRTVEELQAEIVELVAAGNDMILLANNGAYDAELSPKLRRAIRNIIRQRLISAERIEESFQRVLKVKQEYGIEPEEIYLNYAI